MKNRELLQQDNIFTVSRLNSEARALLEKQLGSVWVEGEISNFSAPHSGHWYFSLKDATAQVRCAMFRLQQRKLTFVPKDGMHILLRARVGLYEPRGEYQLVGEDMEERGEGKLRRAFELLKQKLSQQQLFSEVHKKSLPAYPSCIGVVTSPTGAALRDILHVLNRRYPLANVILYPAQVQGSAAAATIVQAIENANRHKACDVLIVGRGGGSLEDLWPFNEEIVAHAIFKSVLPIVSGVGHEVDFSIADFVADVRAPTPSAAAEIITPDRSELLNQLIQQEMQIVRHIKQKLTGSRTHLQLIQKSLQHPKRRLQDKMQHLDFQIHLLNDRIKQFLKSLQKKIQAAYHAIDRKNPSQKISQQRGLLQFKQQQLTHTMQSSIRLRQKKLGELSSKLDALSPLATLNRGFAIATNSHGKVIKSTNTISVGENIEVQLQQGALHCQVLRK